VDTLWRVVVPKGGSVPPEAIPPPSLPHHEQQHHWGYTPPHWGTTGTPTTPTMSSRSSNSTKRDLSEDDCDDVFSEDSKDQ
jgi:hypothetical protein